MADSEFSVCNPPGAVGLLGRLRARLKTRRTQSAGIEPADSDDLNELITSLDDALGLVMAEHNGMADELLCAYEQLSVIFDVNRRLSDVQGESECIGMLLDSIRHSFATREVFIARPQSSDHWSVVRTTNPTVDGEQNPFHEERGTDTPHRTSSPPVDEWLEGVINQACRRKAAVVQRPPEGVLLLPESVEAPAEVLVGPVVTSDGPVCAIILVRVAGTPQFRASDMLLIDSLATFCADLIRNHQLVHDLRMMSVAIVRSLVSAVDQKDEYTCGHSLRVSYYANALGKRLNLSEAELQMLQWGALLHDVGKIGIRDAVLKKEGKLTREEFAHIKEHPVRSHKVVQGVPQLVSALDGILYHHEHYDGTGYPEGLAGEQIPFQARIIQVADVFDALTSDRSYRGAYDWKTALAILKKEAGKTVDPHLQAMFERIMREALEDDPSAWEAMVARASCFVQDFDNPLNEPRA